MGHSLRKSIDAYCKGCIYDPLSGLGTWRQQVDGCTVTRCELYAVRPRSESGKRGRRGPDSADPSGERPENVTPYSPAAAAGRDGAI